MAPFSSPRLPRVPRRPWKLFQDKDTSNDAYIPKLRTKQRDSNVQHGTLRISGRENVLNPTRTKKQSNYLRGKAPLCVRVCTRNYATECDTMIYGLKPTTLFLHLNPTCVGRVARKHPECGRPAHNRTLQADRVSSVRVLLVGTKQPLVTQTCSDCTITYM